MLKCMKIKRGLILNKVDANTIIWKSEYNIHNFKLDKEHQELFNIEYSKRSFKYFKNKR